MQNFITMRLEVFDPRIHEIVNSASFFLFFVFSFVATETAAPILTLNMSNGVVPRKDVPFCGPHY